MKNSYLLVFIFSLHFCFSQNDKEFIQPYVTFENCLNSNNKEECFDDTIISEILDAVEDDVKKLFNQYPNRDVITIYVSFIIGENGKAINESIRTSKYKNTTINKELTDAILNLPTIQPLRNEYNHQIISFYQLFLDLNLDENNKLVIQEKRKGFKEWDDNSEYSSPIYPGCKSKSNKELKKCFSKNVAKIIAKKFNMNKAMKDFNKKGTFKIYVLFKIDENGEITELIGFGPNENFSEQAEKSLNKIKQLKPGTKNGSPVSIPFVLPIKFKI